MGKNRDLWLGVGTLAAALALGQLIAYLLAPVSWSIFIGRLPVILSMIAFWGPIVAVVAAAFVVITMRLLGFGSLAEIRQESVEQNNPAPAIVFVGTLVASLIFLGLVIRT
jgi:hypothetical protein